MAGSDRFHIRLQERDRHLMRELETMRIVDREQAKVVGPFHSTSAANLRLLALTRAGLLKRTFIGANKAVYRLAMDIERGLTASAEGGRISSPLFFEHQLTLNEIYLALMYRVRPDGIDVRNWRRFSGSLAPSLPLIPDGYCEFVGNATSSAFIEVDLGTEPQKVWERKARLYLDLATSGLFATLFGQQRFRVLVVAETERRSERIRTTITKVTDRIFWFGSIQSINRESFWAPIWLRPTGAQRLSLA